MLPMIVISPHKFALLSCMGSLMFFSSIGFLRGWSGHLQTVFHRDRWPFTLLYMGSFLGGLFCSIVIKKYLLTLLFIGLHTMALVWYIISFLPGGSSRLKTMISLFFGNARAFVNR
ncbi:hypothetical protein HMI56_003141 [Coelomomyces lativittatus]|nr:hypothetical protein HMI56_003141 [Coelomomyces lativittatus]